MAALADGIDFMANGLLRSTGCVSRSGVKATLGIFYAVTAFVVLYVMPAASDDIAYWSYCLFTGSAVQLLALGSVIAKVRLTKSVAGLSSQTFALFALSLACRCASNCLNEGYLPADESGDFAYPLVELCCLCCVCYILYAIHKQYTDTYDGDKDVFPLSPLVMSCLVAATCVHAELNQDAFEDSLWAFSLNVETFRMLPQLFLFAKVGGLVDSTQAHFVANNFLAAVLRGVFWMSAVPGCPELSTHTEDSWTMKVGGKYILGMHALHLVILFDFMYHYVSAWKNGTAVSLPTEV